jgi:hypothetical protein
VPVQPDGFYIYNVPAVVACARCAPTNTSAVLHLREKTSCPNARVSSRLKFSCTNTKFKAFEPLRTYTRNKGRTGAAAHKCAFVPTFHLLTTLCDSNLACIRSVCCPVCRDGVGGTDRKNSARWIEVGFRGLVVFAGSKVVLSSPGVVEREQSVVWLSTPSHYRERERKEREGHIRGSAKRIKFLFASSFVSASSFAARKGVR